MCFQQETWFSKEFQSVEFGDKRLNRRLIKVAEVTIEFDFNVRKIRREKNLTQEWLAEKVNVNPAYISLIERGLETACKNVDKYCLIFYFMMHEIKYMVKKTRYKLSNSLALVQAR